jgi:hypothetical protein
MPIKIKMELPYEPMKRTFKTRKEEAFMMVAAFYRTYNWKKRKQVLLQMHY